MARYLVKITETRTFSHYVTLPIKTHNHADLISAARAVPRPSPFSSDFKVTSIGEVSFNLPPSISNGNWGLRINCPVTAQGSIIVYANDEKAARAYVTEKVLPSLSNEGLQESCVPHWYGYRHLNPSFEILSVELTRNPARQRLSFEISVDALTTPDRSWYPLENDHIFEVFRWMVATGKPFRQKCTYHEQTTESLFSGPDDSPFGSDYRLKPILSRKDLKARFQHALLARSYEFYEEWRQAVGFHPGAMLKIDARHYGKNWREGITMPARWQDRQGLTFDALIDNVTENLRGMRMAVSLNSSHPGAIEIQNAGIAVSSTGFTFLISYGYPADGSSWTYPLARTRGDEPFVETLNRAHQVMQRLVPDYFDQLQSKREFSWKISRLRSRALPSDIYAHRNELLEILEESLGIKRTTPAEISNEEPTQIANELLAIGDDRTFFDHELSLVRNADQDVEVTLDPRCAEGMHSWVDDPGVRSGRCTRPGCGEPYGDPG